MGSTGWAGEQGSVGSGGEQPPGVLQELPVQHKGQGVQGISRISVCMAGAGSTQPLAAQAGAGGQGKT